MDRILQEGHNCWRIAPCTRAAFLIDGAAYFAAVAEAVRNARQAVYIVGWDVDSRIRLLRGDDAMPDDLPAALGPFLDALVTRREELHVYILDWDFAMLYALEREPLPIFTFGWSTHKRLHFKLDGKHPVGASHHQKLVVVDDKVAFCGGLDLASSRWDTPEHAPGDPRRQDNGKTYPPFHDVQLLVDGEAAQLLGMLARERWNRVNGPPLSPPEPTEHDPWPQHVAADMEQVAVGILRTDPACDGRDEVCEIKVFYRDAIAEAQSTIYIENQYFTAHAVGEALERRLAEEQGPEVVLVLPRACSGWLEQSTMGVLRARLLARLQQADRHNRLRVFYPVRDGHDGEDINVHAKVLVIDDRLVRVGSSNLNNRSMGFDSECDLAIEAGDDASLRQGIAAFRHRLLAEHLGTEPEEVAQAIARHNSVRGAIADLNGGARRLEPLDPQVEPWLDELVPDAQIIDPERAISFDALLDQLAPQGDITLKAPQRRQTVLTFLLILAAAMVLAALWRWTPLGAWLDVEQLASWGRSLRGNPALPLLLMVLYVVGGFLLVPVTLLILVTALTFGPFFGFVYALAGSLASAMATYAAGHLLGRDRVRNMTGSRINRISRFLAQRGLLTMTAVRLVPVAPFTVVNLVAGASHIRWRDFVLGTLLGMTPGTLAITLFEEGLVNVLLNPTWKAALLLLAVLATVLGGGWLLYRWLRHKGLAAKGDGDG